MVDVLKRGSAKTGAREKNELQDDAIDSSPKSVAVKCSFGPPGAGLEAQLSLEESGSVQNPGVQGLAPPQRHPTFRDSNMEQRRLVGVWKWRKMK